MRGAFRLLGTGVVGCLLAVSVPGAAAQTRSDGTPSRPVAIRAAAHGAVPIGSFIAADLSGRVLVLTRDGRMLRRLPGSPGATVQALELSPDRRHAYESVYTRDGGVRLYDLDLATGRKHTLARAFGPALNPAHTRLAYVMISFASGIPFAHALVVRDLRTHRVHSIPFPPHVVLGTPPELILNWSPDGTRVAVFDGNRIRLVDIATATNLQSQPPIPGPPGRPGGTPFLAPVYLDAHDLVVETNCCIGSQHLATIDLISGARRPFATLTSPPQNLWRLRSGGLLTEDALGELALVSRGRVRVIATHIAAVAA